TGKKTLLLLGNHFLWTLGKSWPSSVSRNSFFLNIKLFLETQLGQPFKRGRPVPRPGFKSGEATNGFLCLLLPPSFLVTRGRKRWSLRTRSRRPSRRLSPAPFSCYRSCIPWAHPSRPSGP
ncbi:unnamed protein product, partial [Musa acuminata var. zebrina]